MIDLTELLRRAHALAGMSLGELAQYLGIPLPAHLRQDKGLVGQLIEKYLGVPYPNKSGPDFAHLNLELKSLPLNSAHLPLASTFLCAATLPFSESHWEDSSVFHKTRNILWIPYEGAPGLALAHRRIGRPLLWHSTAEMDAILQQDWEELSELLRLGYFEEVTAYRGQYLQIRPKAATGKEITQVTNIDGETLHTVPKGFYLRRSFTMHILSATLES